MKKFIALLMILSLGLVLVGCDDSSGLGPLSGSGSTTNGGGTSTSSGGGSSSSSGGGGSTSSSGGGSSSTAGLRAPHGTYATPIVGAGPATLSRTTPAGK
jgi:hypothetical protein